MDAVKDLVLPFVKAADDAAVEKRSGGPQADSRTVLVDTQKPSDLVARLKFNLPDQGQGQEGLLEAIGKILQYSVNTWDQGFLDKLYASNTPVRFLRFPRHPSQRLT